MRRGAVSLALSLLLSACADGTEDAAVLARPAALDHGTGGIWSFGGDPTIADDVFDGRNWNVKGDQVEFIYVETTAEEVKEAQDDFYYPPDSPWGLRIYLDSPDALMLSGDIHPANIRYEEDGAQRRYAYVPASHFKGYAPGFTDSGWFRLSDTSAYVFRGILMVYGPGAPWVCSDLWSYEPEHRDGYDPPLDVPCTEE